LGCASASAAIGKEAVVRSATLRNIALAILALAANYHLGARTATARAPGNPVVALAFNPSEPGSGVGYFHAVTQNGDVYSSAGSRTSPWTYRSNTFGGGPIPVQRETFGALKSRYHGAPGAAQPAPQDR